MVITDAKIKIIKDSRGQNTLEAHLKSGLFFSSQKGVASVPSGKSTGINEVFVLEPSLALKKFEEEVKEKIIERDFVSQEEFDNFLFAIDKTANKSNLGGNLILALSLAFARLKAKNEGKELYEYIRDISQIPKTGKAPYPLFNVINGGAHAKNTLDFQEFQIVSQAGDFDIGLSMARQIYQELGHILSEKFGKNNITLGDEAGYSAPFRTNGEAIEMLSAIIKKGNYPFRIGLDVAANHYYRDGNYEISGKKHTAEELKNYYLGLINGYNILSIEDPFAEEAFEDFSDFYKDISFRSKDIIVITDDLTTTNSQRLKMAVEKKSGNAILVKLNQIGSLSETISVLKLAYQNNWKAIVSHRSGETKDDFIADLAYGASAWGLKSGAPNKPERMAKYNRLSKIVALEKRKNRSF